MANNNIEGTLSTLFNGMDGFISSKSVVGELYMWAIRSSFLLWM